METLLILGMVAYCSWEEVRRDLKNWGSRKLTQGQARLTARRQDLRSRRGFARVRSLPLRPVLAGLDVVWAFGRSLRAGARRGVDEGRKRYAERQAWAENARRDQEALGRPDDGAPHFGTDVDDPTGVRDCATCGGHGHIGDQPCPDCLARQQVRNQAWERQQTDELAARRERRPEPSASAETGTPIEGDEMAITEANGFEALKAGNAQLVEAAKLEFDDAQADHNRAEKELDRLRGWAESVKANWTDQTAAPYTAVVEAQCSTVASKKQELANADAKLAAMRAATAEVEKQAKVHEAARAAGWKDGQHAGHAMAGAARS